SRAAATVVRSAPDRRVPMADGQVPADTYEAPRIDERAAIALPLIGGPGLASGVSLSAAFHPQADAPGYEAPAIESRAPIDMPLIGNTSQAVLSGVFRPRAAAPYKPPAIESRAPIEMPLIGEVSGGAVASASFRPGDAYEPPRIVERSAVDAPLVAIVG